MRKTIYLLCLLSFSISLFAQSGKVAVSKEANGLQLLVDGKKMMVNGMNWDYFPIGTNYSYSLWAQPDAFIKQALDDEMSLLKSMGIALIFLAISIGLFKRQFKRLPEQRNKTDGL